MDAHAHTTFLEYTYGRFSDEGRLLSGGTANVACVANNDRQLTKSPQQCTCVMELNTKESCTMKRENKSK